MSDDVNLPEGWGMIDGAAFGECSECKSKDRRIAELESELAGAQKKIEAWRKDHKELSESACEVQAECDELSTQLATSQERERKLREFFLAGMEAAFYCSDWCPTDIQEKAVELGLARWEKYDPEKHESVGFFDGDSGDSICIINEPFTQASSPISDSQAVRNR